MRRRRRSSAAASRSTSSSSSATRTPPGRSPCSPRARLLTVDEGAVEVAHEALLREWPRLRGWLEADAEGRRLHQHLIGAAREWRDSERDPAELYRGARLAAALDWAAEHDPELNELERAFLDASKEASEREAERQRRADRRLRTLLAGVGVLLAAAVVAGVIALSERQGARSAATVADAPATRRPGPAARTASDQALRLANTGVALDDSVATRSSLLSALVRSPAALGVLNGDGSELWSLALSPDGRTLAAGDNNGTVILFDTETRERIGEYEAEGGDYLAGLPSAGRLARDPHQAPQRREGVPADHRRGHPAVAQVDPARPLSRRSWVDLHPVSDLRPGRTERDRGLLPRKRGPPRVPAPVRPRQRLVAGEARTSRLGPGSVTY